MSVIQDPRFARLHSDPRFQRQPKKERKVVVDKRFSAMLTDDAFQDKAQVVDRYGRKQPKAKGKKAAAKSVNELERLYTVEDDDGVEPKAPPPKQQQKKKKRKAEERVAPPPPEEDDADEEAEVDERFRMDGGAAWDDEEGEDGEEAEVDDDEMDEEEEEEEVDDDGEMTESATSSDEDEDEEGGGVADSALVGWLESQGAVPRVSDGTARLAVCNCNWDTMRAVDLLAVLLSFLPAGGRIASVTVYPSEFGEQRMAEEATVGPAGLLSRQRSGAADDDDDDDDDDDEKEADAMTVNENLRRYELDRLRYYFGVVVCDSVATAEHLYAECDGAEFESSSLPLDLRFIPDDMRFEKTARDRSTELPAKYKAPSFMCSALQQSKPTLSWDADDTTRAATMKRDLTKAEIKEMEYAAYLASDSDEGEDSGEEEYVFEGARPPKKPTAATGGLKDLLQSIRTGAAASDGVDREMTFEMEPSDGPGGRRGGAEDEDELPPTVFEVEEVRDADPTPLSA